MTAESENGLKKLCNVTVLDKEIESLTLSESSTSVKQGSKIQLEAKVKPVDAPSDNLVWSSSDPKVASVDGNGMVFGESEGVVTITCESANGKKAKIVRQLILPFWFLRSAARLPPSCGRSAGKTPHRLQ